MLMQASGIMRGGALARLVPVINASIALRRQMATRHPSKEALPEKWLEAANKEIKRDDAATSLLWHTAEGIAVKVQASPHLHTHDPPHFRSLANST